MVNRAVIEEISVGIVGVDFQHFRDVPTPRPALNLNHDLERVGDVALDSFSAVYGRSWAYLNSLFNLRMSDLAKDQAIYGVPKTRLLPKPEEEPETVVLPLRFRQEQTLAETNLLAKLAVVWGDIPVGLARLLSPGQSLYGLVGLDDDTMGDLVRPGSFVQIDPTQRKVLDGRWATELDRPIYFVEVRDDGYLYL